ncbi:MULTISPECIES: helix-turn-helix domain-containing protein [Lachnospirales]|uniref:XRE family transcriptional regulator n=1 Tax=Anaerotignum lactatifermentans TaxID=160404 RepID=A0A1Y3U7U3_9FIRM|nr:helix-turn-helix transcriptional regulator [Anaerotignum lactatifermentans]OUN43177.1 XRE family transcriptional regulator [Anaerotignum lactatifermentans]
MAVSYIKLFHMMLDRKITNVQLKDMSGVSANIITRLKRDEYVSIESIEKICKALGCGVDDILEFIDEEEKHEN